MTGYSSSKPTPFLCSTYHLSGQYAAGDFLQKTFTNIPLNHYQLIIRFGIAYLGAWSLNDETQLAIDGHTYTWIHVGCAVNQSLCISSDECLKIRQQIISHNTSNLTVRFTTSIVEIDPNQQSWGIKDLIIAARLCHSRCETCFGPS